MKNTARVVADYTIFVLSCLALFKICVQTHRSGPTNSDIIFTAVYGTLFSFLAGLIAQFIAKTKTLTINYAFSFVLAGFATFSMFETEGNHWLQLMAVFVYAPFSILGGLFYQKRYNK